MVADWSKKVYDKTGEATPLKQEGFVTGIATYFGLRQYCIDKLVQKGKEKKEIQQGVIMAPNTYTCNVYESLRDHNFVHSDNLSLFISLSVYKYRLLSKVTQMSNQ